MSNLATPSSLLAALVQVTGDQPSATVLLRETLALALVNQESATVIDVVAEVVDEEVLPAHVEELSAGTGTVVPSMTMQLSPTPRKRSRGSEHCMSAEAAKAQAVVEGLALVKSAHGVTGYAGVLLDRRNSGKPYSVYAPGGKAKGSFLGCFATAEEAALARSRHTGDVVERVVARGASGNTMVCRAPSCGALIDLWAASRFATADGRSNYVVGDGCGSPTCSKSFRGGRGLWVARQVKMATALLQGKRQLIVWPSAKYEKFTGAGTSCSHVGEAEMRSTAESVLEAMDSIEKPRRVRSKK